MTQKTAILLALVSLLVAVPARAQTSESQAKKAIAEGDKLVKKGDLEGALYKYQEAAELWQTGRTLMLVADVEVQLGRFVDAINHYETIVDMAEANDEQRQDASAKISVVEGKIAVVTFSVRPNGATINVDDVDVGVAPLEKPLRLLPGEHRYAVSLPGYLIVRRTMEVAPGDRLDENVQLQKEMPEEIIKQDEEADRAIARAAEEKTVRERKNKLLVGAVLTGAFALGAATTGMLALSAHDDFSNPGLPAAEREDARDSGRILAYTTDALILCSVGAAAYTAWVYVKAPRHAAEKQAKLTPAVGVDLVGVVLSGGF